MTGVFGVIGIACMGSRTGKSLLLDIINFSIGVKYPAGRNKLALRLSSKRHVCGCSESSAAYHKRWVETARRDLGDSLKLFFIALRSFASFHFPFKTIICFMWRRPGRLAHFVLPAVFLLICPLHSVCCTMDRSSSALDCESFHGLSACWEGRRDCRRENEGEKAFMGGVLVDMIQSLYSRLVLSWL